jgi:DNA-binding HxlR family transcriptional regulator
MSYDESCPVCRTAEIVCGKWTLLIIRDLAEGRARFCELERSLKGISPRTLSLRLRALEEEGIVERQTFPEVPPRVEYALTEKGRALVPLIEDMRSYGRRWLGADGDCTPAGDDATELVVPAPPAAAAAA